METPVAVKPASTIMQNTESGPAPDALYRNYKETWGASEHMVAVPGYKIPIKGIEVEVLTANGEAIRSPLKGAGAANPVCASTAKKADVTTENPRSVGSLIAFGKSKSESRVTAEFYNAAIGVMRGSATISFPPLSRHLQM